MRNCVTFDYFLFTIQNPDSKAAMFIDCLEVTNRTGVVTNL